MSARLVHTAHCPFCKQPISAELAQYGGNCPKCMLEIPGEDAPTDPGVQVRARQESERVVSETRRRRRGWVLATVGLLAAGVLLVAGAWRYQQERDALTYDLDDYYVMPLEDIAVAPEAAQPAATVATLGGTQTTRRASHTASGTAAPPEGALPPTTPRASPSSSAIGDALPPEVIAAMAASGGSVSLGSANISVSRPDTVLSDPKEIYDMIKRVLQTSGGQLHACYEQRLKQAEDLRGTWNLEFTVGTDGTATRVRAKGAERGDPELETCMANAVSNWKFMRVNKPQPVQKPYRFAPAY